ncbi:unnamed protein product [Menidia menidia]|uniref:(Atlantic silverside) hypothetical protein n=1 Tax=Menidia menidia TaxID=238744 RepID=A0A8S4B4I1_9TELE|nr:unnamed protein product [Menidia menidia]
MSRPDVSSKRRLQAVEVARGRAGYGFTLTGQSPCLLSCVLKGSPAHFVGLRPGDHVLSVNDINVSKASHEDVVKLIGRCSGVLKMVIAEGDRSRRPSQRSNATGRHHHHHHHHTAAAMPSYMDSCSSDEELDGYYDNGRNNGGGARGGWAKPKMDPKQLGIDRAERVVAELQSGGIFNMIFENSSQSSSSSDKERPPGPRPSSKPRPPSEPDFLPAYRSASTRCHSNPNLLSEEEMAQVLQDDSVFLDTDFRHLHLLPQEEPDLDPDVDVDVGPGGADFGPDPHGDGILNVGMVVGYLGSIELASAGNSLENDSLQAIRGSMRRLRAEQKIHSLVLMKVMHDSVLLCSERGAVLASYPAEKLAFSACCPDDRRFFGLVTMQATDDHEEFHFWGGAGRRGRAQDLLPRLHRGPGAVHLGVARRFGFQCTPDPDTGGCLQFPPSSTPLLQFVSVLYRGGAGVRGGGGVGGAPPDPDQDPDQDPDPHQNHSTSSNSDSGIGNFLPEERINNRVLLVDLGGHAHNHTPGSGPRPWDSSPPSSHTAWSPTFGAPPPTLTPPPPPPPPPPMLRNGHYWHDPHLAELPHPLPLPLPLAPPQTRPPKPELRNQTLETRLLKPDLRNQTPETRLLKPDLRNQTPETRLLKPDLRNQTPETRLLKPDLRNQTPETRLLKPDLRNQTLETRPPGPSGRTSRGSYKLGGASGGGASGGVATGGGDWRGAGPDSQLWLPVHVLRDWSRQQPGAPPPPPPPPPGAPPPGPPPQTLQTQNQTQNQVQTHRMALHKDEWARKLFGTEREKRPGPRRSQREKKPGGGNKEGEKKGGRFRGLTMGFPPLPQRSSARRSFGRSKRLSMARSLDDLEVLSKEKT